MCSMKAEISGSKDSSVFTRVAKWKQGSSLSLCSCKKKRLTKSLPSIIRFWRSQYSVVVSDRSPAKERIFPKQHSIASSGAAGARRPTATFTASITFSNVFVFPLTAKSMGSRGTPFACNRIFPACTGSKSSMHEIISANVFSVARFDRPRASERYLSTTSGTRR